MLLVAAVAAVALGCGGKDFANRPRPPTPIELTAVIQEKKLTVSPAKFGAGPIVVTVSNQTKAAHTVTLEGESSRARIGPINPLDTGTIQETLQPGSYKVKVGSARAVTREIKPAELTVGKERKTSSNDVLQP
jgi:hypothetical protein